MAKVVGFTKGAARRIARTVREAERAPTDLRGRSRKIGTPPIPLIRVRLSHTGSDLYSVYNFHDVDLEDPIATEVEPLGGRPLGANADFIAHANRGLGWWQGVSEEREFILAEAWGEEYDTVVCAP
jgi:hypothetical protein